MTQDTKEGNLLEGQKRKKRLVAIAMFVIAMPIIIVIAILQKPDPIPQKLEPIIGNRLVEEDGINNIIRGKVELVEFQEKKRKKISDETTIVTYRVKYQAFPVTDPPTELVGDVRVVYHYSDTFKCWLPEIN